MKGLSINLGSTYLLCVSLAMLWRVGSEGGAMEMMAGVEKILNATKVS